MNRFVRVYSQGFVVRTEIGIDTETGVNYVFNRFGYAGGFSPLLDNEGKPIVTGRK